MYNRNYPMDIWKQLQSNFEMPLNIVHFSNILVIPIEIESVKSKNSHINSLIENPDVDSPLFILLLETKS